MTDPETKQKHSSRRRRNFLVKKLRGDPQFKKKIHLDEKTKQKQEKWVYDEYYSEED